jgi:hypothetical protein
VLATSLRLGNQEGSSLGRCGRSRPGFGALGALLSERRLRQNSSVPTAQETFSRMLRELVAPALRDLGFKGSGQVFELPAEGAWALLGFQKSVGSHKGEVKFTINLVVAQKEKWAAARQERPYLPVRPSANAKYGSYAWCQRIGSVHPRRKDHWWRLSADSDGRALAHEVVDWIARYALPAFRVHLSDSPAQGGSTWGQ